MKALYLFLFAIIFCVPTIEARKIKTKHTIPKDIEKTSIVNHQVDSDYFFSLATDSLTFVEKIRPAIHFYGFDKIVTSNMESFFISNGLDSEISSMELQITYYDLKGRQLHKRVVSIDCSIPAGETMRTDIKSWDTQKSFYFHKSAKPKRQATPFTTKLSLISVTLKE